MKKVIMLFAVISVLLFAVVLSGCGMIYNEQAGQSIRVLGKTATLADSSCQGNTMTKVYEESCNRGCRKDACYRQRSAVKVYKPAKIVDKSCRSNTMATIIEEPCRYGCDKTRCASKPQAPECKRTAVKTCRGDNLMTVDTFENCNTREREEKCENGCFGNRCIEKGDYVDEKLEDDISTNAQTAADCRPIRDFQYVCDDQGALWLERYDDNCNVVKDFGAACPYGCVEGAFTCAPPGAEVADPCPVRDFQPECNGGKNLQMAKYTPTCGITSELFSTCENGCEIGRHFCNLEPLAPTEKVCTPADFQPECNAQGNLDMAHYDKNCGIVKSPYSLCENGCDIGSYRCRWLELDSQQ
ncbi:hypothetical protein HQ545_07275 [Candidatus Woesearchaeota archaeon]|nr:hypothetical protein [Candidatus Woesearchaeota archaeon]